MDIGLDLILDTSIEPWFWNLPDKAMKERFKGFLIENKGYKVITEKSRLGIMLKYIDAIDELAKEARVTWAFVGVNVDEYITKCDKTNRILYKALKLYKESLE